MKLVVIGHKAIFPGNKKDPRWGSLNKFPLCVIKPFGAFSPERSIPRQALTHLSMEPCPGPYVQSLTKERSPCRTGNGGKALSRKYDNKANYSAPAQFA